MNSQTLLLVDKEDKVLGYAPREECHTGGGKRHRAFVTLLFDRDNQVILHRRRHRLFDGLWDLTAISHPLRINGRDESYSEASDRALFKEMGIKHVDVRKIGAFNYFARDGKNCENEYCAVLVGDYSGPIKPNKDEVYEAKKLKFEDFIADIKDKPEKYTPWARLAAQKLETERMGSLRQELDKFLEKFEPFFDKYFESKLQEVSKYSPLISRFYKDLEDFSRGGKRMRAFLAWLGYRIAGGKDLAKMLPICLACEIAHSFILIHDDIIDKSDFRRLKATVHKRYEKVFGQHYGISQGILVGDVAFLDSLLIVNKADFPENLKTLGMRRFVEVMLETAYGEALDVLYSFERATFSKIKQLADLKTARYSFVGPLTVGSIFAKSSKSLQKAFWDYGILVGTAFQLQDDILGVFGEEKVIGKSVLSDMREGKNTLLIYKTRELAKGKDRKILEQIWGKSDANLADLDLVREIMERCGSVSWSREEALKLVEVAKKVIGRITRDKYLAHMLSQIADFAAYRER